MDHTQPRGRLRWSTIYAICSGGLTLVMLMAVGMTTCRPAWYAPAAVDRVRLKADKADFANLLDRIGGGLNSAQAVEFEISADQLNRWFAARGDIWPALRFELPGVSGVQLDLLAGDRFRLAGTISKGPLSVVLSAVAHCRVEPADVVIEIESLRAGKLPVPRRKVLAPLRQALARGGDQRVTMDGDTIRLKNGWRWKNGDRAFRLERLEIADGVAHVRLMPAAAKW